MTGNVSEVLEIILFFGNTTNGIIMATDNVYLGEYSILDIYLSLQYLVITFWGMFTLVSYKKNKKDDNDE